MKNIFTNLYPFLFALYPILELRNYNIAYVDPASIIRPIVLSFLLTGILWLVSGLLIRDWDKAGIITTLSMLIFFSYGHVFMQTEVIFGTLLRHRFLILIFIGLILTAGFYIIRKLKGPKSFINFLTVTGGILVIFSLSRSILHDLSVYQNGRQAAERQWPMLEGFDVDAVTQKPDIYLILLDAYARSDILKNRLNYDNRAFLQQLEDMGFYVADCSQSNYPATNISVTSLFYADYHQVPTLFPLYQSLVIETVRSLDYKVLTFENYSKGQFDILEDARLSRNQLTLGQIDMTGGLNDFEMMLLKTSLLRIIYDMPHLIPGLDKEMLQEAEFYEHYQQVHFILDKLKQLPNEEGPKFVFAHILVPHDPFIFTPDGQFHWAEYPIDGYVSNVEFINSHIAPVVDEIIKQSRIPPVIIIMSDHGPAGVPGDNDPEMRMANLNVFYVSDQAKKDLYETITPVNTFRVIFNNYFGTEYPLLDDRSYYSYRLDEFTPDKIIPNRCEPSNK